MAVGEFHFADSPVGMCVQPCPCKALTSIWIVSIKFLSEHGVLTDYDKDREAGGTAFAGPVYRSNAHGGEWHRPTSHSMSDRLEIEVVFNVEPADTCPGIIHLSAEARPAGLTFSTDIEVKGGQHTARLTSDQAFPPIVRRMDLRFSWTCSPYQNAKWGSAASSIPVRPSGSGTEVFVTIGKPDAPKPEDITLWRMRKAVKEIAATDYKKNALSVEAPVRIVSGISNVWNFYNVYVSHPFDSWKLALREKYGTGKRKGALVGADCITIASYVSAVINMVGCPGDAEPTVVWAKVTSPDQGEATAGGQSRPNAQDPSQWHDAFYPSHEHKDSTQWIAALVDHNDVPNRYEGCIRFTYGGKVRLFMAGLPRKPFEEPQDPPLAGKPDAASEVVQIFKWIAFYDLDKPQLYDLIDGEKVYVYSYDYVAWLYESHAWGAKGAPPKTPDLW